MLRGPVLRTVTATRYVTPLREGGSLPALMEADDLGTYVVEFIGAGQRGECVDVGVVLYCQDADLLQAVVHVVDNRLLALDPAVDVDGVRGAALALQRTSPVTVRPAARRSASASGG